MLGDGERLRLVAINAGYDLAALEELYERGIDGAFVVEPAG
jgi:hypothetical protein